MLRNSASGPGIGRQLWSRVAAHAEGGLANVTIVKIKAHRGKAGRRTASPMHWPGEPQAPMVRTKQLILYQQ
jgi:hypothetical protein